MKQNSHIGLSKYNSHARHTMSGVDNMIGDSMKKFQSEKDYQMLAWRRRTDGDPLLPIYKESANALFRWEGDQFISQVLALKPAPHLTSKVREFFHEGDPTP